MDTDHSVRVCVDVVLILTATLFATIFEKTGTPFRRGFFCDDESISHPYKGDTVPYWTALLPVALVVPTLIIILIEVLIHFKFNKDTVQSTYTVFKRNVHPLLIALYCTLGPFLFGFAVNHGITNVAKFSIGRLRPHFLAVCIPDSSINCTHSIGSYEVMRYVTEDVCTGDAVKIDEARRSHPSGHSSLAMYATVYAMLYTGVRMRWHGSLLIRYSLSLLFIYLALYTCLSRISDYKHHWSDVFGGAALGTVVALTMIYICWTQCSKYTMTSKKHETDTDIEIRGNHPYTSKLS